MVGKHYPKWCDMKLEECSFFSLMLLELWRINPFYAFLGMGHVFAVLGCFQNASAEACFQTSDFPELFFFLARDFPPPSFS